MGLLTDLLGDGNAYHPGDTIPITDGGTGAQSAAVARTNLGAVGNVGGDTITASGAAVKGLIVKGAASQTANLQEWQDSAGTVLTSVSAAGLVTGTGFTTTGNVISEGVGRFGPSGPTGQLRAMSSAAETVVLGLRGASGQTARLQEWQNNAGTLLLGVEADGRLRIDANTDTTALGTFVGRIAISVGGTTRYIPFYAA